MVKRKVYVISLTSCVFSFHGVLCIFTIYNQIFKRKIFKFRYDTRCGESGNIIMPLPTLADTSYNARTPLEEISLLRPGVPDVTMSLYQVLIYITFPRFPITSPPYFYSF